MVRKSIRNQILLLSLVILVVAFGINTAFAGKIINDRSQETLIEKAQDQVYEMAKHAEMILDIEDEPLEALQDFVDEKASQDNVAYAIIIDTGSMAVAHSDIEKLNIVYEDDYTIEAVTEGKKQFSRFYADVQDIWTYDIMEPIYKDGQLYGVLDVGVPESGIRAIVNQVVKYQIILTIITLIIAGLIMSLAISKIVKSISQLEGVIDETANLNFARSDELDKLVKRRDELGTMASSIIDMRISLYNIMQEILTTSDELVGSASVLAEASGNSLRTTNETSLAINQMAKAVEEQAYDTQNGAEGIESLSVNIDRAIDGTDQIINLTDNISRLSDEGTETVSRLLEWSEKNKDSSGQVADIVKAVDNMSLDISSIVNTINQIAEQTNLLALNAAIESARAGEAGKGFAVVAQEIRQLSEQTSHATEDIKQRIDEINSISKQAVEGITESLGIVEENVKTTEDTSKVFNNIKALLERTVEAVNVAKELSDDMNVRKDSILENIQNISASAEETSAGAEEVSAFTDNQLESIQKVSDETDKLQDISRKLQEEVSRFKFE
ncbi:MAG: methyl-accepting chemotaxis protein [Clostridiales bacterium]|nr:methyl-accepting chemotaxis protein [Clostridiales bacterium]